MFDAFHDVETLAKNGSTNAQSVMESWASGEWFTDRDAVAESIKMVVF
jgi:aconitate hydratase 2/2-methylisocitrate dehydratase